MISVFRKICINCKCPVSDHQAPTSQQPLDQVRFPGSKLVLLDHIRPPPAEDIELKLYVDFNQNFKLNLCKPTIEIETTFVI